MNSDLTNDERRALDIFKRNRQSRPGYECPITHVSISMDFDGGKQEVEHTVWSAWDPTPDNPTVGGASGFEERFDERAMMNLADKGFLIENSTRYLGSGNRYGVTITWYPNPELYGIFGSDRPRGFVNEDDHDFGNIANVEERQ